MSDPLATDRCIERAYRVRLRVKPAVARRLQRLLGARRFVWNWALRRKDEAYRLDGTRLKYRAAGRIIPEDSRRENTGMSASAHVTEQSLEGMTRTQLVRLAERALAMAGLDSLLPSIQIEPSLPAAEIKALAAVGLSWTPTTRERAESARGHYASTFINLFNNADTPAELAKKLGLDPSRIRQRIRDRSLLSVEMNGEKRVPRFQFEGDVEVPGLPRVLAAAGEQGTPLAFAMWFLTPTADLATDDSDTPISPRDWLLRTGNVEAVLAIVDGG